MAKATTDGNAIVSHEVNDDDIITVGRLVEVASRTWPGINKPGGVAKVVQVHFDAPDGEDADKGTDANDDVKKNPTHVNVRYVVGSSREKRVPVEYVQLAPQYETHHRTALPSDSASSEKYVASSLRDRSMLLGRCRRCGSLRTDCGSCDWATEEEAAVTAVPSNYDNTQTNPKKSLATRRREGRKRHSSFDEYLLDDESSTSSSDDDEDDNDMTRLRQLIRQSQQRGRHRESSKNNRRSSELAGDGNVDYDATKKKKEAKSWIQIQNYTATTFKKKWRRRYPVLLDDSSSSSSDSLDSVFEGAKISKRRKGTTKNGSRQGRKRIMTSGKSVLESLPTTNVNGSEHPSTLSLSSPSSTTNPTPLSPAPKSSIRRSRIESHRNNDLFLTASPQGSDDEKPSTVSKAPEGRHREVSSNTQRISYEQQLLELEARARFRIEDQQQHSATMGDGNGDMEFIQPEGQEAVENLPEDVVDLSRSIHYKDLGQFFDTMASKVEDEILPDFKLKLAGLHRELRSIQDNGIEVNSSINSQHVSAGATLTSTKQLLDRYHQLWDQVRLSMIHNGTDQCRATLRRLMDDKLYRRERKHLTLKQRKQCRGAGIMDSRNLTMDALDNTVEAFIRKLKEAVVLCESQYAKNIEYDTIGIGVGGNDDESDDSSRSGLIYYDDDASVSSELDNELDSLPITAMANVNLPKSISGVRKDGSNYENVQSNDVQPVVSNSSNNDYKPYKKRAKITTSSNTKKRNQSTNRKLHRSSMPVVREDANNEEGKRNAEPGGVISNVGNSETDFRENSFEVNSAGFSGPNGRKRTRSKKRGSGNRRPSSSYDKVNFSVPRNPKQSISERMQAFLDSNMGNGIQTEGEKERAESSIQRKQYTKKIGQLERQFSASEPRNKRKNGQSDERLIDGQRRMDESQANEEELQDNMISRTPESRFTSCDTYTLFSRLSMTPHASEGSSDYIVADSPSDVDKNWEDFLSEMEAALLDNPISIKSFLHRAYSVLRRHGGKTIQEMISSNDGELSLHIRTFALCVRSLNFVLDDEVPIIFTKKRKEYLFDFLVLQMVDSLYALSLPAAWALDVENKETVVRKLIPLRNALGLSIPLVETVSRCIVQSFECQQWRKSQCNDHLFVSSLNPNSWIEFLQSGQRLDYPPVTRFQKLGRVWPRIEVEALWRILAFTSSAQSTATDKSIFRLQVISKLFSSGVFATGNVEKEHKLPPTEAHLLACQQEVGYFSALVRKGVLNPLPKSDSMVVKLVQHSLQLQSDSYKDNECARTSCLPDPSDDIAAKKMSPVFWRKTNPLNFAASEAEYCKVSMSDFPFDQFHKDSNATYKKILYPSSNILLSCLSLVLNWTTHISQKKARQNRLMNSLKALQNDLLKEANELSNQSIGKAHSTFEDVFSIKPSNEVGISSERLAVFKQESASYFQVIVFLTMKNKSKSDLSESVWKNMSDEEMTRKQSDIIGLRENKSKFTGDAYRLFATAKIMATVLLVQINASPWHLSFGTKVSRLFADSVEQERGNISFVMCGIFGCLDCLCDIAVGPQLFTQFYEIIILVFGNLTAAMTRGERYLDGDHITVSSFHPVLVKCIKMHLTSSKSSHESFHLGFYLSLVRIMHTFVITECHLAGASSANVTDPASRHHETTTNNENGDDMWGELDDSDLAALNLGCNVLESEKDTRERSLLWEILSDALDQSKPSRRYAILGSTSTTGSKSKVHLSSIGKFLVADRVHEICACFSVAIASLEEDDEASFQLTNLVSKWIKPSYQDDEDSQFFSKIATKLSLEVCTLAEKYPKCQDFVFEHAECIMFNFFKELLNSSRLEKFPSCNLERIGENAGKAGTEQALLVLDLFNDDSFQDIDEEFQGMALRRLQNRRRKKASEIWDFCSKLGAAFSKNLSSDSRSLTKVGRTLLNIDRDLCQKFYFLDDVISLENEMFKIFRLLRNIISCTATNTGNFDSFERVSSCSLLFLANHVLSIVQSLKYNDQISSDGKYKKATLSELLSSFVELFVSLSSWILREGAKNQSKAWSFLQTYLRDRLFSPILRNQSIDPTISLQEVIASARFVLERPYSEVVSLPSINCAGLVGCSKYLQGHFLTSILRRSKQLFVATALNPQNLGLQNAILEGVMGCSDDLEGAISWRVGMTFPLGKSRLPGSRYVWPYSSPIQKQIDEYLEFVEEKRTSSFNNDDWWNSMAVMKKSFLKNHLLPRLHSSSMGIQKKRRILMLLNYMLEYDTQTPSGTFAGDGLQRSLDLNVVRDIVKAVRSNIHTCLMQHSVDNDLACITFSCSMHLANAVLLLEAKEQNLLRWSHVAIRGIKGKTMLDLSNMEILGSYIWIFFQWLEALGHIVVNRNEHDNPAGMESITLLRKHWQKSQCCRYGGLDEERIDLDESKSLEAWDRLLIDFEDLAFPSKMKNNPNDVVNIYAKSLSKRPNLGESEGVALHSWKPWVPSIAVERSLKELMAGILSAS